MEASRLSGTEGAGDDGAAGVATGEVAAMATVGDVTGSGVGAAGDFTGVGGGETGGGGGEFCATIAGGRDGEGDGVGVGFLFFASLPPFGVGVGFAGGGVTTATFGGSTGAAGSTRINSFAAGGAGVGARPATEALVLFGETRSRYSVYCFSAAMRSESL